MIQIFKTNNNMGQVYSKKQVISAEYDYDKDPNSGAIGTVHLGVTIPKNSLIISVSGKILVNFDSADFTSKISFGYFRVDTDLAASVDAYYPATLIGVVNSGINNSITNGLSNDDYTAGLTMSISVEPIDAGRIVFTIEYIEYNNLG